MSPTRPSPSAPGVGRSTPGRQMRPGRQDFATAVRHLNQVINAQPEPERSESYRILGAHLDRLADQVAALARKRK